MKVVASSFVLFAVLVVTAITVGAQDIKYGFDRNADFSKFKTYKWQRAEKGNYDDAVVDRILKSTISEQLAAKGMTPTEDDNADVYVLYQLAVGQDVEWSSFNSGIAWQTGANTLAGFQGATTNATTIIRKGWLMIDIYDSSKKKLIWQANAVKTLGKGNDPKKMENNARKAMAKIFKNYPPVAR